MGVEDVSILEIYLIIQKLWFEDDDYSSHHIMFVECTAARLTLLERVCHQPTRLDDDDEKPMLKINQLQTHVARISIVLTWQRRHKGRGKKQKITIDEWLGPPYQINASCTSCKLHTSPPLPCFVVSSTAKQKSRGIGNVKVWPKWRV